MRLETVNNFYSQDNTISKRPEGNKRNKTDLFFAFISKFISPNLLLDLQTGLNNFNLTLMSKKPKENNADFSAESEVLSLEKKNKKTNNNSGILKELDVINNLGRINKNKGKIIGLSESRKSFISVLEEENTAKATVGLNIGKNYGKASAIFYTDNSLLNDKDFSAENDVLNKNYAFSVKNTGQISANKLENNNKSRNIYSNFVALSQSSNSYLLKEYGLHESESSLVNKVKTDNGIGPIVSSVTTNIAKKAGLQEYSLNTTLKETEGFKTDKTFNLESENLQNKTSITFRQKDNKYQDINAVENGQAKIRLKDTRTFNFKSNFNDITSAIETTELGENIINSSMSFISENKFIEQIRTFLPDSLKILKNHAINKIELSLEPEYLGKLKIEVINEGLKINILIKTSESYVNRVLQENIQILKDGLTESGLIINKLIVEVQQNNQNNENNLYLMYFGERKKDQYLRNHDSTQLKLDNISSDISLDILNIGKENSYYINKLV